MFSVKKFNRKDKKNKNNSARLPFNHYNKNYASTQEEDWNTISMLLYIKLVLTAHLIQFTSFLLA